MNSAPACGEIGPTQPEGLICGSAQEARRGPHAPRAQPDVLPPRRRVAAPRHTLPPSEMDPDTAYQFVHDELMLDGNARLNLATFVTTWMEPQARAAHGRDVRQEHDRQGRVPAHRRARAALRQHAQPALELARRGGGDRAPRRPVRARRRCSAGWRSSGAGATRQQAAGKPTDQPNMVMGANVQVCWEKFCRYWDVETRARADGGRPLPPDARRGGEALRREHDRRRPGARFDVRRLRTSPSPTSAPRSTGSRPTPARRPRPRRRRVGRVHRAVHRPGARVGLPPARGCSRSTRPGHKYGLVYPGVGWVIWRNPDALPTTSCST